MATQAEGRSLSSLERDAEHTRADLIQTVDELHSRVSPRAIKEEVKAYARDTGNELIYSLERKARENPLQTVAIAAGLAYPAWRFLIKIPAPILLVGAGLAFNQFGASSRATSGDANARSRMSGSEGDGEQLTDSLRRTAQDTSSNMSHAAEGLKEKVMEAAEQAKSGVNSGVEAVRSRATAAISDTANSARAAASDTMTAATDAVSATYRSGIDAASRTGDQLGETFRQSKESLFESIENHPWLVGGVGLLIGAVIASALPVSQAENRLFGDTSNDLKNRARDVASEGLAVAKTAAQDVYQESVSRAQEEGLSPDLVRQTVKGVGYKVKNVVQQAADAMDEEPEITSSSAPSVVPHT
jgi:gas vesicle protein